MSSLVPLPFPEKHRRMIDRIRLPGFKLIHTASFLLKIDSRKGFRVFISFEDDHEIFGPGYQIELNRLDEKLLKDLAIPLTMFLLRPFHAHEAMERYLETELVTNGELQITLPTLESGKDLNHAEVAFTHPKYLGSGSAEVKRFMCFFRPDPQTG